MLQFRKGRQQQEQTDEKQQRGKRKTSGIGLLPDGPFVIFRHQGFEAEAIWVHFSVLDSFHPRILGNPFRKCWGLSTSKNSTEVLWNIIDLFTEKKLIPVLSQNTLCISTVEYQWTKWTKCSEAGERKQDRLLLSDCFHQLKNTFFFFALHFRFISFLTFGILIRIKNTLCCTALKVSVCTINDHNTL